MKNVFTRYNDYNTSDACTSTKSTNNHACCAERRLLDEQLRAAQRHGVPPHQRIAWARRKFGGHMVVWRARADGTVGCSMPCVLCRQRLIKHDIIVHAICDDNVSMFHGRMTDAHAPPSRPTSGQHWKWGWV
jgi:hypothetical protein